MLCNLPFEPVFLPGEFFGQRSLVDYSPWGLKEPDTTEHTHAQKQRRGLGTTAAQVRAFKTLDTSATA